MADEDADGLDDATLRDAEAEPRDEPEGTRPDDAVDRLAEIGPAGADPLDVATVDEGAPSDELAPEVLRPEEIALDD